MTADELLNLPQRSVRYELIKGKLHERPFAGARDGNVAMQAGLLLASHAREFKVGVVFAAGTGFILERDPDTVRAPVASFVSKVRLPAGGLPDTFLETAPDLVVEVVSRGDRASEVQQKVEDWLRAGTTLIWVLDPAARTVTAHTSQGNPRTLTEDQRLFGDPTVPGFACDVSEFFL